MFLPRHSQDHRTCDKKVTLIDDALQLVVALVDWAHSDNVKTRLKQLSHLAHLHLPLPSTTRWMSTAATLSGFLKLGNHFSAVVDEFRDYGAPEMPNLLLLQGINNVLEPLSRILTAAEATKQIRIADVPFWVIEIYNLVTPSNADRAIPAIQEFKAELNRMFHESFDSIIKTPSIALCAAALSPRHLRHLREHFSATLLDSVWTKIKEQCVHLHGFEKPVTTGYLFRQQISLPQQLDTVRDVLSQDHVCSFHFFFASP